MRVHSPVDFHNQYAPYWKKLGSKNYKFHRRSLFCQAGMLTYASLMWFSSSDLSQKEKNWRVRIEQIRTLQCCRRKPKAKSASR